MLVEVQGKDLVIHAAYIADYTRTCSGLSLDLSGSAVHTSTTILAVNVLTWNVYVFLVTRLTIHCVFVTCL